MSNLKKWEDIEKGFNFTAEEDEKMEQELNRVKEEIKLRNQNNAIIKRKVLPNNRKNNKIKIFAKKAKAL